MTEKRFDQIVDTQCETIKTSLIEKGREYRRNNDPFHNFNQGAKKKGIIREKVLDFMALKHEVSIDDMTNDIENGKLPSIEVVEEKFKDAINYLILKKASIIDRIESSTAVVSTVDTDAIVNYTLSER